MERGVLILSAVQNVAQYYTGCEILVDFDKLHNVDTNTTKMLQFTLVWWNCAYDCDYVFDDNFVYF